MIQVGDLAPGFALPAHDGSTVVLESFRGHAVVVLYFYGRDDTPG